MKIFVIVSKNYARQIFDAISNLKPKPYVLATSFDEEVEVLAKYFGHSCKRIDSINKVAELQELKDFDIAITALDDDAKNIAALKIISMFNIPIIISILHNKNNRDLIVSSGATHVINLDELLYANICSMLIPDTWIITSPLSLLPKLKIAVHRFLRRAALGVTVNDVLKALKDSKSDVSIYCFNRFGNRLTTSVFSAGDYIVITGFEEEIDKAVKTIERLFSKYEEMYASRYSVTFRMREYG